MIGQIMGQTVMMQLGSFKFSISTAAYQELKRRSDYSWASQDRFGKMPALQFTGPGSDSITLSGVIYTEYRGGVGQLNNMRSLAATGTPQRMIDGTGNLLGKYVIESVEEGQSVFAGQGQPRKQSFTMQLRQFPEDSLGAIGAVASAIGTAAGGSSGDLDSTKSSAGSFLDSASSTASSAISSMTSAMAAVQDKAQQIGNAVGPIVSTTTNAVRTASLMKQQIDSTKASMKNMNSLESIQSAMYGIMGTASTASQASVMAADTAKAMGLELQSSGASTEAVRTVATCQASCGKGAVAASRVYSGANAYTGG